MKNIIIIILLIGVMISIPQKGYAQIAPNPVPDEWAYPEPEPTPTPEPEEEEKSIFIKLKDFCFNVWTQIKKYWSEAWEGLLSVADWIIDKLPALNIAQYLVGMPIALRIAMQLNVYFPVAELFVMISAVLTIWLCAIIIRWVLKAIPFIW